MKGIIISIIIAATLVGGAILLSGKNPKEKAIPKNNVSIEGGRQIVEIRAKGGYLPRESVAKAGIPTTLRINTSGTFDCSSSVRIPSLKIYKNLPPTGTTDIDLGSPKPGILYGSCGMGMYPFEINFQG